MANPLDDSPTCALCMQPVHTTMLRVMVWAVDHGLSVPEDASDEDATLVVVHRSCFEDVKHPDYAL